MRRATDCGLGSNPDVHRAERAVNLFQPFLLATGVNTMSLFKSSRCSVSYTTVLAIAMAWTVGTPLAFGQGGVVLPGLGGNDLTDAADDGVLDATITDPFGGVASPTNEAIDNFADNDVGSKYLVFQNGLFGRPVATDPVPVTIEFLGGASHAVTAYTLTSANDAPERDPYEFTLSGSNDGTNFDQIDFRTGVEFGGRFETQVFFVDNATAYSTYRIEMLTEFAAGGPFGSGDIFQVAELELFDTFAFDSIIATVNRDSGEITIKNDSATPVTITGYSITSAGGSLNSGSWTPISGNTDGGTGNGTVDNDPWVVLTEPGARGDLSEVEDPSGDGTTLAAQQEISLGNAWIRSSIEDVSVEILLDDLTVFNPAVVYSGNDGLAFRFGDLTFDGEIDADDWNAFKDGQGTDFSNITSAAESYAFGDLDRDFDHDLYDFATFERVFNQANGEGALASLISGQNVPEPAAGLLVLVSFVAMGAWRLRGLRHWRALAVAAVFAALLLSGPAQAGIEIPGLIGNDLTDANNDGTLDVTVTAGGNAPDGELPPNALDNNTATKWLSFEPNGTFYQVEFTGGASHALNSYTITSGGDAPERDPYSWTLSGSNDGVNFSVVDTQEGETWSDRGIVQQFLVGNSTAFTTYRFDFLTQQGAGVPNAPTPNSIQIGEIELLDLANPQILTLEVNTSSGAASIQNNSGTPIAIDSYTITSAAGSLGAAGWDSLESQNLAGFPAGNGSGNGWEEGSNPNSNELAEYNLLGSSTFGASSDVSIGDIFAAPVAGDYDGNGSVGPEDYSVWRDTLNSSVPNGTGADGNADGTVNENDYSVWKNAFGSVSGAGIEDLVFRYKEENGNFVFGFVEYVSSAGVQAGSATVPEPSGLALLALGGAAILFSRQLRNSTHRGAKIMLRKAKSSKSIVTATRMGALVLVFGTAVGVSLAASPERNYRLGDDPDENANPASAIGDIVGVNVTIGGAGDSLDSQGPSGAFQDLTQVGDPLYTNTAATSRPFAGASELGVTFNGTSQFLQADGIGNPGEGDDAIPLSYEGIFDRTMQAYVRPTNQGSGERQDVYFDTTQFGMFIDEFDNWGIQYGQPGTVQTALPVNFNTWTHVMHRTNGSSMTLYLDGIASRAVQGFFNTNPAGQDENDLWIGAGVGGATNFFEGDIDDFQLLIAGDNSDVTGGQDYGVFNLGVDNEFIRDSLAADGYVVGDVNGDGLVNGDGSGAPGVDDVTFFVDHWLDQNVVDGIVVGDLDTRTLNADLNFSGTTNLFDWAILRANHENGNALDLASLLAARSVPEPSTAAGLLLILGGLLMSRRNS